MTSKAGTRRSVVKRVYDDVSKGLSDSLVRVKRARGQQIKIELVALHRWKSSGLDFLIDHLPKCQTFSVEYYLSLLVQLQDI